MADITLTAADGTTFSAHRADPDGTPRGAVIVIQEIFGVNGHIRSVADRFAAEGYLALAPALFDRVERGVELAYDQEGMTKGVEIAWNLPIELSLLDLVATLDAAAAEVGGVASVGATGFCFGGMLTAALACREADHLGAAVAYYPSMAGTVLAEDVPTIPLMVQLGDRDQRVTIEEGLLLAERWPTAVFHRYEADHGFNCDVRATYDADAAAVSWDRTLAFFADHLAAAPGSES